MKKYDSGSEWGKWDLHVHTASSYDYKYKSDDADELLVKSWRENEIVAVAITDHFLIDHERIEKLMYLASDVTIFPGVELRCDKGTTNLHIILIFPVTKGEELKNLSKKFEFFRKEKGKPKNSEKTNPKWEDSIFWDYNDILAFANENEALISIHTGKKSNGIDEEIKNTNEFCKEIKKDIAKDIDIFEIGKKGDVENYKKIVFEHIEKRPLIICSDNHDPRSYNFKERLWIKSKPTFEGLKQILYHPEERVYIGDRPPVLENVNKNKKSYIKSINIEKIDNSKNKNNWFKLKKPIYLNVGLTAIIGSKGSGKSALADIIAHTCGSETMEYASFLHKDRFKKSPENYANDYECELIWQDGEKNRSNLGIANQGQLEEVQYLPQKYIELVCNELGSKFQEEINNVIFSYIDSTERGEAANLEGLIELKASEIKRQIKQTQLELKEINSEIIKLEDRNTVAYKKNVEVHLNKFKDDYERHLKNKPNEVLKPKSTENTEDINKIEGINLKINDLQQKWKVNNDKITNFNLQKGEMDNFEMYIKEVGTRVREINEHILSEKADIDFQFSNFLINYEPPISKINEKILEINTEKIKISSLSEKLLEEIAVLEKEKESLISFANKEEKDYQQYLKDLKEWELGKEKIIGDIYTDNTIKYYEKELNYINNELSIELGKKISLRNIKITNIFENIEKIVEIYKKIYYPIEQTLSNILGKLKENIEFSTDIKLTEIGLAENLLELIDKSINSEFKGKKDGFNKMKEYIEETNFSNLESLINLIDKILIGVSQDKEKLRQVVKKSEEFYDKLTNLEYIGVEYTLKMGGRNLQELSPGERGIVLLIFYLALSKNEIPLIIDQPEDNLDNESVYDKLVPCILEAKNQRQVIIVTHNPNIAIACDAEQIVYCSINKKDGEILYDTGSIEEFEMRKKLLNILEGTKPAFLLRELKYDIKSLDL